MPTTVPLLAGPGSAFFRPEAEAGRSVDAPMGPARAWPIVILGVPFDPMTLTGAVDRIETMILSNRPHFIVTPNVGVTYTGSTKKLAEHGGFAHDDTNVMLLLSNPMMSPRTVYTPVGTNQWQVLKTGIQGNGTPTSATDSVSQTNGTPRYYRVVATEAP